MEKDKGLIQKIAMEGAEQTVQALALAQQMNMLNSDSELILMIASAMEETIEEYINLVEEKSKIILNETRAI